MPARSVQISLDEELLNRVDARPETARIGRSAVIRRALVLYLERARKDEIDAAYERAYGGGAALEVERELAPFLRVQAWPDDPPAEAAAARPRRQKRRTRK